MCFFFLLVVAVDSVAANMPVNLTHFVAFLFVFLFASQLFSSTFRFAVFINHVFHNKISYTRCAGAQGTLAGEGTV